MEFQEDLKIDQYALDIECRDQPELSGKYGVELAEAIFERDKVKRKVKVVRAETEQSIRIDPESFGVVKVTEGSVQAAVETNEAVKEAEDDYIQTCRVYNLCLAATEAFKDRKKQLENMVQLLGMNYFSEPRTGGKEKEVYEKSAFDDVRGQAGEAMKRRGLKKNKE